MAARIKMAPHNHLHQHYGRSSNDSNSRAQSSSSKAGGAKAPYKRSEVDEAAATHNAQVANTSTNRVGRWVQEQRGSAAMTRCSEEATRAASMNRRQTGATVHQSGQNGGTGSMIAAVSLAFKATEAAFVPQHVNITSLPPLRAAAAAGRRPSWPPHICKHLTRVRRGEDPPLHSLSTRCLSFFPLPFPCSAASVSWVSHRTTAHSASPPPWPPR